jgi:hypothetical protein
MWVCGRGGCTNPETALETCETLNLEALTRLFSSF